MKTSGVTHNSIICDRTHLDPKHLRAAVEGVASFGKEKTEPIQPVADGSQKSMIPTPTVTKTGNEERETVGGSA